MEALSLNAMIGSSALMEQARVHLQRAACSDCTVLVTGETGTGKELVAELIHANSSRHKAPFVCINCAAIPDSLLESELFGHTRGAFTGAEDIRDGLLASANGGTVFLDEIGDMSLVSQAKLLRVIEKKEVCRIGGYRLTRLNVRFLAASNQELEDMVSRGTFRRDLFFRLNVVRIHLPPLRDRKDDIPLLLKHYCRNMQGDSPTKAPATFSEECIQGLLRYDRRRTEFSGRPDWQLYDHTIKKRSGAIRSWFSPRHLRISQQEHHRQTTSAI